MDHDDRQRPQRDPIFHPVEARPRPPAAPVAATAEPAVRRSTPPVAYRGGFFRRAGRWTMRLIVLFLFLQLGLWLFVGRKSLIQLAPDMIADDVSSVASLNVHAVSDTDYPERVYIISERLVAAIGEDSLYRLETSLGAFNGRIVSEDDGTYVERANQDGCGDCLFVGIRQTMNTPFLAKSYTSYTRPLMFTQMHGIEQRSQEREHIYVWLLGRWVPLRTTWLSG